MKHHLHWNSMLLRFVWSNRVERFRSSDCRSCGICFSLSLPLAINRIGRQCSVQRSITWIVHHWGQSSFDLRCSKKRLDGIFFLLFLSRRKSSSAKDDQPSLSIFRCPNWKASNESTNCWFKSSKRNISRPLFSSDKFAFDLSRPFGHRVNICTSLFQRRILPKPTRKSKTQSKQKRPRKFVGPMSRSIEKDRCFREFQPHIDCCSWRHSSWPRLSSWNHRQTNSYKTRRISSVQSSFGQKPTDFGRNQGLNGSPWLFDDRDRFVFIAHSGVCFSINLQEIDRQRRSLRIPRSARLDENRKPSEVLRKRKFIDRQQFHHSLFVFVIGHPSFRWIKLRSTINRRQMID